jgi:hemerythrin-like metal-binding protein
MSTRAETLASAIRTGTGLLDSQTEALHFLSSWLFHPGMICASQGAKCRRLRDAMHFCERAFAAEDRLMLEAGYPDFACHRSAHADFLASLARFYDSFGCSEYDNRAVAEFIETWATQHVATCDKPLAEFLKRLRVPPAV